MNLGWTTEIPCPNAWRQIPIGGFRACSLVDFPAHLAAVVFLRGCDFRCPWCHNPSLVEPKRFPPGLDAAKLWSLLLERRGRLDGLVVSGGEPTLHRALPEFIADARDLGYAIKLDTHGGHPEVLRKLLERGVLDYVAMDVKAGPRAYATAVGRRAPVAEISRSIELLRSSRVDYEFRLTVTPDFLDDGDLAGFLDWLDGAPLVALQGFRPGDSLRAGYGAGRATTRDQLEAISSVIARRAGRVLIRE